MRAAALILALGLAACADDPLPSAPPVMAEVPEMLRTCPPTPAAVPVPSPPRSFASVVAYANKTDAKRAETARDLDVCRQHLTELLAWHASQ